MDKFWNVLLSSLRWLRKLEKIGTTFMKIQPKNLFHWFRFIMNIQFFQKLYFCTATFINNFCSFIAGNIISLRLYKIIGPTNFMFLLMQVV